MAGGTQIVIELYKNGNSTGVFFSTYSDSSNLSVQRRIELDEDDEITFINKTTGTSIDIGNFVVQVDKING